MKLISLDIEVSEYQYTISGYFPLTDDLKQRLGTVSSRR